MSAKPGAWPCARAASDRLPATSATATSKARIRSRYRCSSVSSQAASAAALRTAPAHRALAMPSVTSATVTAERKSAAEFLSIQPTKAAEADAFDGAPAEMTLVSIRYKSDIFFSIQFKTCCDAGQLGGYIVNVIRVRDRLNRGV